MSDRTPKEGGPPGLQKTHTLSRTNPETGEVETRDVTQQEWKNEGKALRSEGWARPEDEDDEVPEEPVN